MSTENQEATVNAKVFEVAIGWMVPHFAEIQIKAATHQEAKAKVAQMLANNEIDIYSQDWRYDYDLTAEAPIVINDPQ